MGSKENKFSKSMTGFGRADLSEDGVVLDAEIRSVNSRYLDISFRIPKNYQQHEPLLRTVVAGKLERGRVDITVNRAASGLALSVKSDQALAEEYYQKGKDFFTKLGVWSEKMQAEYALQLFLRREVLDREEEVVSEELEQKLLVKAVGDALDKLVQMREREGESLASDIRMRFKLLADLKSQIESVVSENKENVKQKLHARIEKIYSVSGLDRSEIDEQRLALEVAILVDKADIQEELVRIDSHLEQVVRIMNEYPHGRKLEFILQELGREFNTIASKSQVAEVNQRVVDAKSELEKIKEQILNIE